MRRSFFLFWKRIRFLSSTCQERHCQASWFCFLEVKWSSLCYILGYRCKCRLICAIWKQRIFNPSCPVTFLQENWRDPIPQLVFRPLLSFSQSSILLQTSCHVLQNGTRSKSNRQEAKQTSHYFSHFELKIYTHRGKSTGLSHWSGLSLLHIPCGVSNTSPFQRFLFLSHF